MEWRDISTAPKAAVESVVDGGWNTDTQELTAAVKEFEAVLPGFWWSVGQCSVGAHASCAVDGNGVQKQLLDGIEAGNPFDAGFHCDTHKGTPAQALRDVMQQALSAIPTTDNGKETT